MDLDKILRKVGVYNFDPSNAEIVICGFPLNDFTNATIQASEKRQSEQGVDVTYHTYVVLPTTYDINISFLAACPDIKFMEDLQDYLDINKGYFELSAKQNGRYLGKFDCYFKGESGDTFAEDAEDKSYTLVALKQDDSIFKQEQFLEV